MQVFREGFATLGVTEWCSRYLETFIQNPDITASRVLTFSCSDIQFPASWPRPNNSIEESVPYNWCKYSLNQHSFGMVFSPSTIPNVASGNGLSVILFLENKLPVFCWGGRGVIDLLYGMDRGGWTWVSNCFN